MMKNNINTDLCQKLKDKKLFLFDMDGTIYEEDKLFDGTLELMTKIIDIGGKYVFITNNSSKSIDDYIKKISEFGIKVDSSNFFTSIQATIMYLNEKHKDELIFCMGTKSMIKELNNNGINLTTKVEDKVSVVLIGFDTELTYEKIIRTCNLLKRNHISYIATNCDLACPVSFGFIPDCGAMCKMISYATGKMPIFIGKPEPTMVNYVINKTGFKNEETVVIGDRLYTDIAAGNNAGVTTICVLTGETKKEDILVSDIKPTIVLNSVYEIIELLEY